MSNNVIKRSLAGVIATLNSTVSSLSTKIVSGKFKIINATTDTSGHNLNTIYDGQETVSIAFIEGQHEQNAPYNGTIHYVLSFKASTNYGLQFCVVQSNPPRMYMRRLHNGAWQDWYAFTGDAGKAVISARWTANYTVGANTYKGITTADFDASIPSGYTPFSVMEVSSGANNVAFRQVNVPNLSSSTGTVVVVRNLSSSEVTANATLKVGFIKSDLIS